MYQLLSQNYWQERNIPVHLEYRNCQAPFPMHSHDFHEIVYVYSGTATHLTPQGNYDISAGDVLSIKPGQIHGYKKIDNLSLMNILVYPPFFTQDPFELSSIFSYRTLFEQSFRKKTSNSDIIHFHLNQIQSFVVRSIIESMQHEIASGQTGYCAQITSLFIQFLIFLMRVYENDAYEKLTSDTPDTLIVKYMEKNFRLKITLENLAERSGMSNSSVLRAFKRLTGFPPFVYQNRLRLLVATSDLVQTNKAITKIALDAGFNDSNYFSRSFKKIHQMSPVEFRQQFGENFSEP